MPVAIGRQQQAYAESRHDEGQRCGVEFLDGGDKADQQESACQQQLLSFQSCKVGEQRATGHGDRKDGGRYSNAVPVEQPVGQRSQRENNRCFDGKGAILNGAGIGCRRGEIGHYCATCPEGKIANQRRCGALAQPPPVVS